MKTKNNHGSLVYINNKNRIHRTGLPATIDGAYLSYRFNGEYHRVNGYCNSFSMKYFLYCYFIKINNKMLVI